MTLNELAMKAKNKCCNFEFEQGSHTLTDINLNGVQITKTVHITIKTEKGSGVSFVTGKTILKLHFRRKKNSINTS